MKGASFESWSFMKGASLESSHHFTAFVAEEGIL